MVNVAMTARAEADEIARLGLASVRVFVKMMELQPDLVRAAGSAAAPTVPSEEFCALRFRGVSSARVEAESGVLPGSFRSIDRFGGVASEAVLLPSAEMYVHRFRDVPRGTFRKLEVGNERGRAFDFGLNVAGSSLVS